MKIKWINYNGIKPTRAHYDDAGLDCFYYGDCNIDVSPWQSETVRLGFGVEIPNGYVGLLLPRSSLNKKGLIGRIGVIDSGYRGEVSAIVCNQTMKMQTIKPGDKISQLVIVPCAICELVDEYGEERKTGGFGSTGR